MDDGVTPEAYRLGARPQAEWLNPREDRGGQDDEISSTHASNASIQVKNMTDKKTEMKTFNPPLIAKPLGTSLFGPRRTICKMQ